MCGCSEKAAGFVSLFIITQYVSTAFVRIRIQHTGIRRRLLILSDEEGMGPCTTFQAGEPELYGTVAKSNKPGRETALADKQFL